MDLGHLEVRTGEGLGFSQTMSQVGRWVLMIQQILKHTLDALVLG